MRMMSQKDESRRTTERRRRTNAADAGEGLLMHETNDGSDVRLVVADADYVADREVVVAVVACPDPPDASGMRWNMGK